MIYFARMLAILIAIPVHEYAHGYASYRLGDPTAKHDGRLSLNPLTHFDPVGIILIILTGIGWAKPVRINSMYYKDKDKSVSLTALAGPASNLLLALFFSIISKLVVVLYDVNFLFDYSFYSNVKFVFDVMVVVNVQLAIFNMIPFPPLDGFKVFSPLFSPKFKYQISQYEQYSFIILIVVLYSGILNYPISIATNFVMSVLNMVTSFLAFI